jgi:signal transduction histidine kinase
VPAEPERLRELSARLPGGALYQAVLHPDGRLAHPYISAGITALVGVTPEEAVADAGVLVALLHDADRDGFFAAAAASAAALAPFDVTVRQRTRAGEVRWMHYRAAPRRLADGGTCWDGVQLDVTAQVGAAERARDEARRRAVADAAAAVTRAMDAHLAAVSSELRAPITPALTLAHTLALSHGLTAEQRQYALGISRWIALEARLLDDLVDHERLTRGTLQLRRTRVDAHGAVRHALLVCEPMIASKRLTLVEQLDAEDPWLHADPVRLPQVVWNLVQHAARATPPGGRITVRTALPSAHAFELTVDDTGVGIPRERLARVFDPPSLDVPDASDASDASPGGGLGIGLSLSRRLAEAHGGTLVAYSAGAGHGTTFTLRLPR